MKLVKHIVLLFCIAIASSNVTSDVTNKNRSKNKKKAKGRKLCANCMDFQSSHQNPYMYSMMAGNPYMANPMMGGMMNPMAAMAFNPFLGGMGPAAMPPMNNPYMMNPMNGMGPIQNTGMYQQGYEHHGDEMKLHRHLFKKYHDVLAENFEDETPAQPIAQESTETSMEQQVEPVASLAEEVQHQEEVANAKRKLNGFNTPFGQNNLGYNYNQFGNRLGGF